MSVHIPFLSDQDGVEDEVPEAELDPLILLVLLLRHLHSTHRIRDSKIALPCHSC